MVHDWRARAALAAGPGVARRLTNRLRDHEPEVHGAEAEEEVRVVPGHEEEWEAEASGPASDDPARRRRPSVPLPPMSMPSTERLLDELSLGRAWATALETELTAAGVPRHGGTWDGGAVTGWARRMVAASDLLTIHQYRLVAMRLASFSPAVIRERAQSGMDRGVLERCGLMLALRYTTDLAPMKVGRAGHRLVRDGIASHGQVSVVAGRDVERLWLAGVSLAEIAASSGLGPTVLGRLVRTLPPRLTSGAVTARFGWSPDNIFQKLSRGTFPVEDGREGQLRWWWGSTVQAWEQHRTLVQCPHCPARVERLGAHLQAHTTVG